MKTIVSALMLIFFAYTHPSFAKDANSDCFKGPKGQAICRAYASPNRDSKKSSLKNPPHTAPISLSSDTLRIPTDSVLPSVSKAEEVAVKASPNETSAPSSTASASATTRTSYCVSEGANSSSCYNVTDETYCDESATGKICKMNGKVVSNVAYAQESGSLTAPGKKVRPARSAGSAF